MKITPKNSLWFDSRKVGEQSEEIVLRNDQNANLRTFYFMLFSTCLHRSTRRQDDRSKTLLLSLKNFIYAESTILSNFGKQYPCKHSKPILCHNTNMKHALCEFLQLLESAPTLFPLLSSHPILDPILLCLMRSLILSHHYSPSRLYI